MSDKYDDERLFKFFVEHGYFPRDYEENKVLKKDIETSNKNTLNHSAKNEEHKETLKDNITNNYTVSEEERLLFINAIKNLDCSNHSKKELPKKNIKFKPKVKNAVPKERIDLHGLTADRALIEVKHFIGECKKNKISPILIIHGKGFGSENKIPVLKNTVEYYIATEGKPYIKYASDAPRELGGSGAKLIYLNL
ncbi:Smr/MutS family protein [Brachyspira pilosicoli]|uniref:Smr domain-containing protein n=3 Tax=Brachyspira pilosicoli TaxID=52584 RepID=A0A3B6W3K3_BRAPL|nr:Smr/MutS family protein [Brachyspira pilosicoli]AFR69717.1 Smr domain-containing protein [Brachyspira pilosicoli B2904]AGA67197.1 Smr domain-containing protein [Brachyspira pilosicoli P43/6/78]MBW5391491.1 DNA mismatch repair protein MutS [Brachyspira pilosicoli]PLV55879.1 DNA mismatch repair protein MutS [Brachyspira pilosicoli SP16]WIH80994.1 Smr/MutS family protein [Brachyspira pilosicoli]